MVLRMGKYFYLPRTALILLSVTACAFPFTLPSSRVTVHSSQTAVLGAPSRRGLPLLHMSSTKSPADRIINFVESTAASVTDYIFMRKRREIPDGFRRVQTQFIAALGDPGARSGRGAQEWGLWRVDPGPRGVFLSQYGQLLRSGGRARSGWTFDSGDWWLEEHGIIMEPPAFPLPSGRYVVTGGRQTTSVLTIGQPDRNGVQAWSLDGGELYDVTHLPCRAARYVPTSSNGSPATADLSDFPVTPGETMPAVAGCTKRDYAVLFVVAVED